MTIAPVTPVPQAEAADDLYMYSAGLVTGPLFAIASAIYQIPVLQDFLPTFELPIFGEVDVPYFADLFTYQYPVPLPRAITVGQLRLQDGDFIGTNIVIGVMDGALAIGQAINMIQHDIVPEPGVNHYYYFLIRNPGRANGGMASRFDWLFNLFGLPGSAVSGNASAKHPFGGGFYDSLKVDVAFGYDSMDDFPISPLASVAIINSVVQSLLPTNYLGPTEAKSVSDGSLTTGLNVYLTVVPQQAALLEPLRLPSRILGMAGVPNIFFPLNTIADVFERPVEILTNVGYADVDLTTYERSFDQFTSNKQFFFDSTLTWNQYITAFRAAIDAAVANIAGFFGASTSTSSAPPQAVAAVPSPTDAESRTVPRAARMPDTSKTTAAETSTDTTRSKTANRTRSAPRAAPEISTATAQTANHTPRANARPGSRRPPDATDQRPMTPPDPPNRQPAAPEDDTAQAPDAVSERPPSATSSVSAGETTASSPAGQAAA